jgi:Protein of unknown function (DUF1351)
MNAVIEPKQDLIQIDPLILRTTPAAIVGNFDEVEAIIKADVAGKMLLVTPETTKTGKDQAAEFRKNSKTLASSWKSHKDTLMADVNAADKDIKKICAVWDDGAREISDQVAKIEQETKDLCLNLLVEERLSKWEEFGVTPEFCTTTIDDLALLGSINKGKLTKGAKTEVERRCKLDRSQQDKVASRLVELENRCMKADINPPFTRKNIEHFIFLDDMPFYTQLDRLINNEIDRKAGAERLMRERIEKEQADKTQRMIDDALAKQKAEDEAKQRDAAAVLKKQRQDEDNRVALESAEKAREQVNSLALECAESTRRTVEELKAEDQKIIAKMAQEDFDATLRTVQQPDPGALVTLKVTVLTKTEFEFSTKASADHGKIKDYFRKKVVDGGTPEEDIYEVMIEMVNP